MIQARPLENPPKSPGQISCKDAVAKRGIPEEKNASYTRRSRRLLMPGAWSIFQQKPGLNLAVNQQSALSSSNGFHAMNHRYYSSEATASCPIRR